MKLTYFNRIKINLQVIEERAENQGNVYSLH